MNPSESRAFACVLVVKLGCGCASRAAAPASPEATVTSFARALNEGNLRAAYALMSANSLSRVRGPARGRADLNHRGEGDLVLVQRDGYWFVASDVARVYDQSTPRAALRAFARAIEHKRYDVVLRLVPNAPRGSASPRRNPRRTGGEPPATTTSSSPWAQLTA